MDSIDKLLAELKAEYKEGKNEQKQSKPTQPTPSIQSPQKSASLIDNLLAEVKADFQEREHAEELRRQQELEQERIQQEQIKAKQLQDLSKFAQSWLAKLDLFSPEGLWFERFAERYSSKLEAAIDYLKDKESIK
ncbi:salt stress protein, Slr1339 family [Chlorogloeopsis fritschii PCC 9212]|uniref:Uncharacterized protein n=1 Tax=Chlorogloeopsis fritschii PCC 6912 TaxID=211165 RepID=A0A433NPQ7_CHLFR|nr:hypothetical protein [Chlorogloeopsis fritschii]RUR85820.1 hypothetical protein PCC6912_06450 [Chlorogloeopsis fritschii PCC 6912]